MQRFKRTHAATVMAALPAVLLAAFVPLASAQVGHGAAILRNAFGPNGASIAHVGETVTSVVRVRNLDDFNDSITVTSIVSVIHHATGDVVTPNLLPAPAVLPSFGDFVSQAFTYPVLATDGELLTDHATAGAVDNFDSEGGTRRPRGFLVSFPAQIRVLRPCIQVAKECSSANGQTAAVTTLVNCGNGLLTNVTISNLVNGVAARSFGPAALEPGQTVRFTNSVAEPGPGPEIVSARGTDELGLTVSQTSTSACPVVAAQTVPLRLTGAASNKVAMTFSSRADKSYALQWSDSLRTWQTLSNITGNGTVLRLEQNTTHPRRFYRLLMNP